MSGLFRLLLRAFPRRFRKAFGAGMLDDLLAEHERARAAGRLRAARMVVTSAADLIVAGLIERVSPTWGGSSTTTDHGRWGMRGDALLQDVRFALRGLRRNPGFTAVALLTLALGIGANSAVFSVVNGVVLEPLPYPEADALVLLHQTNTRSGETQGRISHQDLQDWQERSRSVEPIAGFASVSRFLVGEGDPLEVELTYVTPRFFDVLGVEAEMGRFPDADEHRLAQRSAVVSHSMWRSALGGDPEVLGRRILLNGEPHTVVGVAPAGLAYPTPETDVWIPHSLVEPNMFSNGLPGRGDRYLEAVGRLTPAADAAAAQRELTAVAGELAATYPDSNADWGAAAVVPLHDAVVGDVDRSLMTVLAGVGFILLIACANLANLSLARGSARQRELAVRTALGADRGRVARQLLTESLVLASLGGLLGLALSWWGVRTILALSAETLPRVHDVQLDARVMGFTLALTVLTGLLFGLAPALRLAHAAPQRHLRGGRGGEGRRLRSGLVVAEVALAVLLLVGASLMGRSFLALRSVDPGFEPEGVLTATMQMNLTGVSDQEMAGFLVQRREEILRRVRALPGVESAGMINVFPLQSGVLTLEYAPADADIPEEAGVHADTRYVDPGYTGTMRIPLLQGEPLPESFARDEPVPVLLSASAAQRLWPEGDAVGRRITVPWGEARVVGVVGDVRQVGLAREAQPAVYFPQLIAPRLLATLVVRTAGEPSSLGEPVRRVVGEIDPNQPVRSIRPLTDVLSASIAKERFFTLLLGLFGGLAMALSAVGVYGVLAYVVRQRTREIGIRMAMGADAREILGLVAVGGLKLVGLGLLLGTVAAMVLTRVLASQLYGVAPTDPLAFALAIGVLSAAALLAGWVPARRAMRLPPRTILAE